jgi:hypothetical protein
MAKRDMKTELIAQNKAKVACQHDLTTDIIDRKHADLHGYNALPDKIQWDNLIDNEIRSMNESKTRCDLFTLLNINIKGFISPSSIKRSALTRVDITVNDGISYLTTKAEIEEHFLQCNPLIYWASDSTPFGHSSLGRLLGDTGQSPVVESIHDGSFTHSNYIVCAFTSQLRRRPLLPDIPPAKISERTFPGADGGPREKSAASPSGLYNAHYMCMVWW